MDDLLSNANIRDDAMRLAELDRLVVRAVIASNMNDVVVAIDAYVELKKSLRERVLSQPVITVEDQEAAEVIRKISSGAGLSCDKIIKRLADYVKMEVRIDDLDAEKIESLGEELFCSWYSHHEYVSGLNELGSLILRATVPASLSRFVREAKDCYAFQQYNAAYGLCRIIIEASVRDICFKKQLLPEGANNSVYTKKYPWSELCKKVSSGTLKDRLDGLYGELCTLIHGRKTVTREEARYAFQETLKLVQDLYTQHGL